MGEARQHYRKRGWFSLALGRFGWVFASLLCVGVLAFISELQTVRSGWLLNHRPVEVTGRVTNWQIEAHQCRKGDRGPCPMTILAYEFLTPEGQVAVDTLVGRYFQPEGMAVNGSILVRYLAENPDVNEVEFGLTFRSGVWGCVAGAFFALMGSSFGSYVWWANHLIRMRGGGVARKAVVLNGPEQTPLQFWVIKWRDEVGETGQSLTRLTEYDWPKKGEEITIYADPQGKLPAVWEGDCGSR